MLAWYTGPTMIFTKASAPRHRRAHALLVAILVVLAAVGFPGPTPASAAQQFVVTNTSGDPGRQGSLPWALQAANNNGNGLDYVSFAIPGSGIQYIQLGGTLFVTEPVLIDGTSQSPGVGYPTVYLLGSSAVSSIILIAPTAGGSTVRGLGFLWYVNNAITVFDGADGSTLDANWIGFAPAGTGVFLNNSAFGLTAGLGIRSSGNSVRNNVISGVYNAIVVGQPVEQAWDGREYRGNSFSGNRIGTDPAAFTSAGFGNSSDGIFLGAGVKDSWIGPGNVFSGNGSAGVEVFHWSNTGNVIFSNQIGSSRNGDLAIGNGDLGIQISEGASYNSAWGNTIVGNVLGGVAVGTGATGNWIENNLIGMDQSQQRALGTQDVGVSINSFGTRNVVRGNVIGGHSTHGVILGNANGNGVYNNWIGQGGSGAAVANGGFGVLLLSSSYNYVIGNAFGWNHLGGVGQASSTGNVIY